MIGFSESNLSFCLVFICKPLAIKRVACGTSALAFCGSDIISLFRECPEVRPDPGPWLSPYTAYIQALKSPHLGACVSDKHKTMKRRSTGQNDSKPSRKVTDFFNSIRSSASASSPTQLSSSPPLPPTVPPAKPEEQSVSAGTRQGRANSTTASAKVAESATTPRARPTLSAQASIKSETVSPTQITRSSASSKTSPAALTTRHKGGDTQEEKTPLRRSTRARTSPSKKPTSVAKARSPNDPAAYAVRSSVPQQTPLSGATAVSSQSPPRRRAPKKSSPSKTPRSTPSYLKAERIPTSQSDEEEMTIPRSIANARAKGAVKKRLQLDTSPSCSSDEEQDVLSTSPLTSAPSPHSSEDEHDEPLAGLSSANTSPGPRKTPLHARQHPFLATDKDQDVEMSALSELSSSPPREIAERPLPPSPVALDTASKTEALIAQIRSRAAQRVVRSSSEDSDALLRRVGALAAASSSESDEEDVFAHTRAKQAVVKSTPITRAQAKSSASKSTSSPQNTRYALRKRSASSSSSDSDCNSPVHHSRSTLRPSPRARKRPRNTQVDPLGFLLSEKHSQTTKGTDADALQRAEAALARRAEVDGDSDEECDPLTEEDAARVAARRGRRVGMTSSPGSSRSRTPEKNVGMEALDAGERKRLLGSARGKQIGAIIDHDRATGSAVKREVKAGVRLWAEGHLFEDKREDIPWPEFTLSSASSKTHPIVTTFAKSVKKKDLDQIRAISSSGLLAVVGGRTFADRVASWILAFAPHPDAEPVFDTLAVSLVQLLNSMESGSISMSSVFKSTLVSLGAGFDGPASTQLGIATSQKQPVNASERSSSLTRLVNIATLIARSPCLDTSEIQSLIITLLLISMDPSISPSLHRLIVIAIDELCSRLPANMEMQTSGREGSLAHALRSYAFQLDLVNQVFLLSHLGQGCIQGSRLARWLAHALLQSDDAELEYVEFPSLTCLLDALSVSPIFAINDDTDYEALGHRVSILATALSDIDGYAALEKKQEKALFHHRIRPDSTPKAVGNKKAPLDRIQIALDVLHNQIVDTRAAHLDRSRTKAALQRLSHRLYHQGHAAQHSGKASGKPRRVTDFFQTRSTPSSHVNSPYATPDHNS